MIQLETITLPVVPASNRQHNNALLSVSFSTTTFSPFALLMPPYGEPDWATPGDTTKANVSTGLPAPAAPPLMATTNGNTADGLYV
jgi:hypothetical protein